MNTAELPVVVKGLSAGGAGIWVLVFLTIGALFKAWPVFRKLNNEADASLRTDLMERIDKLEKQLSDERRECDRAMAALRGDLRALQEKMDGLVRQLIAYQIAEARTMPVSAQMDRALGTLDALVEDHGRAASDDAP